MFVQLLGTPALVNTTTGGEQSDPTISALEGGGFVVAWTNHSVTALGTVTGQRFDATAKKAGGEFSVVGAQPTFNASVTGLSDGGFVIGMDEKAVAGNGTTTQQIVFQRYDAAGNAIGSVPQVVPLGSNSIQTIFGIDRSGSGYVYAEYSLQHMTQQIGFSTSAGAFGTAAGGGGSGLFPAVTTLSNGRIAFAWSGFSSADGLYHTKLRVFDSDGSNGNPTDVDAGAAENNQPAMAALPDGRFAITWAYNGDVHARLFDNYGNSLSSDTLVNTTTASSQYAPHAIATPYGGYLVVYGDASSASIRGQAFDPLGRPMGQEFLIGHVSAAATEIAATHFADGRIVVSWTDSDGSATGIYAQTIDAHISFGLNGSADKLGDFSGDGKADLLQLEANGKADVWLSSGHSLDTYKFWGSSFTPADKIGDFNGDGKDDVVQLFDGNQRAYVWTSNGTSFNAYAAWGTGFTSADRVGDFNGDGRDDVVQILPGNQHAYVWTSNGATFNQVAVWGSGFLPTDKIANVDEAGTGAQKADLVQFLDGSQRAYVATSTGTGFNAWQVWGTGFTSSDRLADFNGDGRADAIQILPGNQNAYVWLSTGTSFAPYSVWSTGFTPADKLGDFNGDGKQDVLQTLTNGRALVWLSNGHGFDAYSQWGSGFTASDQIADFNGDGLDDVLQLGTDGRAFVWLSNGHGFDPYSQWGYGVGAGESIGSGALDAQQPSASSHDLFLA